MRVVSGKANGKALEGGLKAPHEVSVHGGGMAMAANPERRLGRAPHLLDGFK
jgi:hypothetical protein